MLNIKLLYLLGIVHSMKNKKAFIIAISFKKHAVRGMNTGVLV